MTDAVPGLPRLESLLAGLLHYGTWLASAAIGVGFALALIDSQLGTHDLAILPNMRIATIGIAFLILLPSLRVFLMLIVFARERDYRLALIAALVLTVVLLGFLVGIRTATAIAARSGRRSHNASFTRSSNHEISMPEGGLAVSNVPLAGFSNIEAADVDEVIGLVAGTPCARAKGAIEIRPIMAINDQG